MFPQQINVLLIEGDAQIATDIMEWLKEHQMTVTHVFPNEGDVVNLINNQPWNLVITDIDLPNFDDVSVTKLVKIADSSTPVLIVTEHKKINFILSALQNHADGLQFKPLHKAEFTELAFKLIKDGEFNRQAKQAKIILAIGAHPDDVEIGCGGALINHTSKGDKLHILTLSLGASGGDPEIRKKESEQAAAFLGASLHFGSFTDTKISVGISTITYIEEIVNQVNPTHIYTHSIHDNHRDHRNVHQAAISACRQVPNFYCFQSPSSSVDFQPNLFIEISEDFLQKKLQAISFFKSQCKIRPYLKEDMIRASARYWGRFSNYTLVEPMELVRHKVAAI